MDCMRTGSRSDDDQLVRRLLAPPDLEDGVQSLEYWGGRSRHLPWYRLSARREAARMTASWEQRVRTALIAQRGVPAALRLSAGLVVAQTRLGRWTRRARIVLLTIVAVVVTVSVALVAIYLAAVTALLLQVV
jgi:hypothetical protein